MTSVPGMHPSQEALAEFAGGPTDLDGTGPARGGDAPVGLVTGPARGGEAAGAGGGPQGRPEGLAHVREHLGRCPRCRDEVAMLRAAARALAALTEPELPPGLHDRLVAAVRAEHQVVPAGGRDGSAPAVELLAAADRGRLASRRRERSWRRYRWAVAAAATLVLVVAGVSQMDGPDTAVQFASRGSSGGQEQAAPGLGGDIPPAPAAGAAAPRFQAGGDYDLDRLRVDLASRADMRAAYRTALAEVGRAGVRSQERTPSGSSTPSLQPGVSPGGPTGGPTGVAPDSASGTDGGREDAGPGCSPPAPSGRQVFLIDADYRGRPAILVVSVAGDPAALTLSAYARDDCAPLGTERGAAPPP